MSKFKIGDRVVILIKTSTHIIGDKAIISYVGDNPDTFDVSYIYKLGEEEIKYFYEYHLELDIEYYRNEKLTKLGI